MAPRRGSPEFTEYCDGLENMATTSRAAFIAEGRADEDYLGVIDAIEKNVFTLEILFWDMALEGHSSLYAIVNSGLNIDCVTLCRVQQASLLRWYQIPQPFLQSAVQNGWCRLGKPCED